MADLVPETVNPPRKKSPPPRKSVVAKTVAAVDEAGAPEGYVALMRELWHQDPVERPTFAEALRRLRAMGARAQPTLLGRRNEPAPRTAPTLLAPINAGGAAAVDGGVVQGGQARDARRQPQRAVRAQRRHIRE